MESESPRPRDAVATRSRLLLAARSRFAVFGYDRTTTRDVAADAGVNVSLISRYFGSKDGLYTAVLAESAALVSHPDLRPAAEPADSPQPLAAPGPPDAMARRRAFLDRVVAGLRPEAWPQYGHEHPLLLVLRDDTADPALARLRRESMLAAIRDTERALDGASAAHAELVMALVTGLVALRSLLGESLGVLGDEASLRAELERVITDLAPPEQHGA